MNSLTTRVTSRSCHVTSRQKRAPCASRKQFLKFFSAILFFLLKLSLVLSAGFRLQIESIDLSRISTAYFREENRVFDQEVLHSLEQFAAFRLVVTIAASIQEEIEDRALHTLVPCC